MLTKEEVAMLTKQESAVLYRARRDGKVIVVWDSEAERACKALLARGWLMVDEAASQIICLVSDASVYTITEEGKRG